MKRTKISYALSITMLLLLIITACKKEPMPAKPQPSAFTVELKDGTVVYPASGAKVDVVINAGSNGWWMVVPEESKSWCTSSKLFGSGDQTVVITLAPNTTGEARKAEVVINPTFNLEPVKLVLEQSAN